MTITVFKFPNYYIQRMVTSYFQSQPKQTNNYNKPAAHGIYVRRKNISPRTKSVKQLSGLLKFWNFLLLGS